MVKIKLLDGNFRSFEQEVDGIEIARSINSSLAKNAIAIKVNGIVRDLSYVIKTDAEVSVITPDSEEGLDIIRHDTAHILAQAVKELYDDVQVTIGPNIENGFYYDFACNKPFLAEDLVAIENKMREIVKRDELFVRKVMSREEAIKFFAALNENYKVEIIKDLPLDEEVSIYTQGDFADLCRGPHSPSTKYAKAFKLTKVAGAYWRGDSKNAMLQRIYGTAWATAKQLEEHLKMLEEAEKRDHRKLGKEMNLFHFQEEAPGVPFWHPKGWELFQTLIDYMRNQQKKAGYAEIGTPEIIDRCLWEQSGHWEKFHDNMFIANAANDDRTYAVRPMNCPGGVQVFKQALVSYRDLPMRLSEFGKVYRFEPSGALHGLMRVRGFTQDDAHIFCTEEQMMDECQKLCKLILKIYSDFGFHDVRIKFSDRPEKRVGSDEVWDKSEQALLKAIQSLDLNYTLNPGEGAFYGPKIEFVLRDAIGRDWQLGTLQVDLNLPVRLGVSYIAEDGKKHSPVMLHRAVFGSLERFIGILIEHYAGNLPLWLSPVQLVIASITNESNDYANDVYQMANKLDLKAIIDLNNETLNYKIRKHSLAKVPIIIVVGQKESLERKVSVRRLGSNKQESFDLETFMNNLVNEVQLRK